MIQVDFPFPFANNYELNLYITTRYIFYKITLLDKFAQFFIDEKNSILQDRLTILTWTLFQAIKLFPRRKKKEKKGKEKGGICLSDNISVDSDRKFITHGRSLSILRL